MLRVYNGSWGESHLGTNEKGSPIRAHRTWERRERAIEVPSLAKSVQTHYHLQEKLSPNTEIESNCPAKKSTKSCQWLLGTVWIWSEGKPESITPYTSSQVQQPSLTCKEFMTPLASTAILPATDLTPCLNWAMSAVGITFPRDTVPVRIRKG